MKGRGRRRAAIAALAVLALVALHALVGTVLLPWLVRRQVPAVAAGRLHRRVTLAGMRFNPYTLTATFVGVDLRDRDGTPLLAADTVVVDLAARSALRRAVVLDELRLHHPAAVLRLGPDGRPTVADLFEGTDADSSAGMPRVAIRHALLRAGELDLVDESRRPVYREEFRDLALELNDISTLPDEDGSHALTARFASGATIAWRGHGVLEPLQLEGRFDVAGLRLPKLNEVFAPELPLHLVAGELDASVPYRIERGAGRSAVVRLPSVEATLRGLAAVPSGGTAEWVRVEQVELRGAEVEWPARRARVRHVLVQKPWLSALRLADGTLDWQSLRMPEPAATGAAGPAWSAVVDSVTVEQGTVHVEDHSVTPTLTLDATPIDLTLGNITTDSAAKVGVRGTASVGDMRMRLGGTVTRSPTGADLEVEAQRLDLTLAQRYLGADAPVTLVSGEASLKGTTRLRSGRPSMTFEGSASVRGALVRDREGDSLLAWRTMDVEGIRLTSAPDLARIRQVTLTQPFARIAISRDREINLARIGTELIGDTAAADEAWPYEVGQVRLVDGVIDFSDESLVLPFRTTVDSTQGSIEDVASFGGTPGSMTLEGVVRPDGLARATGTLHATDPFAATDVEVEFRNLDLAAFTPYSAQFAGYAITSGRLDMDLRYRIRERALDADHHVVAKDLQLGEKVEGGESPGFLVKVAISLLKDRDGRITLDVPVTGTVDDPQFSYRGIVWTAVKQVLGRIATAPFRFFGKLLGIGGDTPELVEFEPGRSDLIPPEREKLDSLAALLQRKPDLVLGISGRYDPVSDAEAIRVAKLQALVAARRDSLFRKAGASDTSGTTLGRTLESLYEGRYTRAALDSLRDSMRLAVQAQPPEGRKPRKGYEAPAYFESMRARLLAEQTADSAELVELGRARGAAIAAQLVAGGVTDAARLGAPTVERVKGKKEGDPRIASELSMDAR